MHLLFRKPFAVTCIGRIAPGVMQMQRTNGAILFMLEDLICYIKFEIYFLEKRGLYILVA
ncbi:hypothetical protein PSTEL_19010 [Paenibacillus stellifer]|uniref:Uncharacterized protein n=1 Tax=Paenibacillus stellifer TaxID=169760 RepID=A0A089LVK0_9BACL|nr:hypothetical protein PSTEL_19010 [Paenibacillus stellifer]